MKKSYLNLILLFLLVTNINGQEMPIDFNDNSDSFIVFGEVSNSNPPNKFDVFNNPEDNSDRVAECHDQKTWYSSVL